MSTSNTTEVNRIATKLREALPAEVQLALSEQIAVGAQVIALLPINERSSTHIFDALETAGLEQLCSALKNNELRLIESRIVDLTGAQMGDINIGDIASGNISKSSTTINIWLWEDYSKDVLAWLAKQLDYRSEIKKLDREKIQETNRQKWKRTDWAKAATIYRQEMTRLYGSMHIFGMNQSVPLSDVFTDVYLLDKPSAWRRHTIEELSSRSPTNNEPIDSEHRFEGGNLVMEHRRIFILGQPGSGKTTFLKHLVIQAVQGQLQAIPIFVSLKAWSDENMDLMPYLVRLFEICNFPDAKPFIETILEEGRAIVLFDGLDEVNVDGGKHQRVIQAIRDFSRRYGNSRIVITCRTAASEYTFEHFGYCEIAEFTRRQIIDFVSRWFQKDRFKQTSFLKAFANPENERLLDLAKRPLLLTMLCITFEETMTFPQRRAELYEEAIDALLKKWDTSRNIQRDLIYRKLSLGYKRQLLMELAAETFEKGEFFMPKRALAQRVKRFLRRLPPVDQTEDIDGEAVLRAIEAQHGILVERARDIYSFSHLTFHEYFTACYIADHPSNSVWRAIVSQAPNPQWREVLLLTVSMLDYFNVKEMFNVWFQDLRKQIQGEPLLANLLRWVEQQAAKLSQTSSSARAAILMITVLDQAIVASMEIANSLERARSFEDSRDWDNTRNLAIDRTLAEVRMNDIAYALNKTHYIIKELEHAREQTYESAVEIAKDIDRARTRILPRDEALDRFCKRFLARDSDIEQAKEIIADLKSATTRTRTNNASQDRTINLASACVNVYMRFSTISPQQSFVTDRVPQQDWQLTEDQMHTLEIYLTSTLRFLECLDVAIVENRDNTLNQLLVSPT